MQNQFNYKLAIRSLLFAISISYTQYFLCSQESLLSQNTVMRADGLINHALSDMDLIELNIQRGEHISTLLMRDKQLFISITTTSPQYMMDLISTLTDDALEDYHCHGIIDQHIVNDIHAIYEFLLTQKTINDNKQHLEDLHVIFDMFYDLR